MTLWSMGANQSTVGTLKNRALINLCLATGNIGRPGAGPLSLTGQPNAMGGRETGGLAHLLPGYRRVDDAARPRGDGGALGLPLPSPLSRACRRSSCSTPSPTGGSRPSGSSRPTRWCRCPTARASGRHSRRAELVVVQDAYHPTETSALAHAVLPAAAWPEKEGTMTNSERRVGLVRRALRRRRARRGPTGGSSPGWRGRSGSASTSPGPTRRPCSTSSPPARPAGRAT